MSEQRMKITGLCIFLFCAPTIHAAQSQPKVDWQFLVISTTYAGSTVADLELTQKCIRSSRCREGNPMLSSSRTIAYSESTAIDFVTIYIASRLRPRHPRIALFLPALGIASHSVGIWSGVRQ